MNEEADRRPTLLLTREPSNKNSAGLILKELLRTSIVSWEDYSALAEPTRAALETHSTSEPLIRQLLHLHLLTPFQADRIRQCSLSEIHENLVVGNYRLLDCLGSGGMGVVFRGEHLLMRRQVAIKVLLARHEDDPLALTRFQCEMRATSLLRHPNIVTAFDAGRVTTPGQGQRSSYYLVMEYVEGQNLEDRVELNGTLSVGAACHLAYQVASGLSEVHEHKLVHRDIKPSNVLVTRDGVAKLLDFGLVRHLGSHRMTQAGSLLGTLGYMAPEQLMDSAAVDIRADIYGLGGILFWCLAGRDPVPCLGTSLAEIIKEMQQPAPPIRSLRADVPPALEQVIERMLATRPEDRYPHPQAALRALLPFLNHFPGSVEPTLLPSTGERAAILDPLSGNATLPAGHSILIADDEPVNLSVCSRGLQREGFQCTAVSDGRQALDALGNGKFDLILLDMDMPELTGPEVLHHLRRSPPCPNLKVIMLSGRVSGDEMSQMLAAGADDYLVKPVSPIQLLARVKAVLQLKAAQDRSAVLTRQLVLMNNELEHRLNSQDGDLIQLRSALVLGLAQLVEQRTGDTPNRLHRIRRYCRTLAEAAAELPALKGLIDEQFIGMLECCAPLHDVGKVVLPDELLRKPGRLTEEETFVFQSHTVIGGDILRKVVGQASGALAFLQMAADIARHHHERHDGKGYPDRLSGTDIPLAARIVAIADVYDALRSRRPYRPALTHQAAMTILLERSQGHFDPVLLEAAQSCAPLFHQICREWADTPDR